MIFLLTMYAIALVGLAVLFLHKKVESRRGAPLFSPDTLARLDKAVEHTILRRLEKAFRIARMVASLARLEMIYKLYTLAIRAVKTLHDKSAHLLERLQGRQVSFVAKARMAGYGNEAVAATAHAENGVSGAGSMGGGNPRAQVSFFLKHISEGKEKK